MQEITYMFYVSAQGVDVRRIGATTKYHAIAIAQGKFAEFAALPTSAITAKKATYSKKAKAVINKF